MNEEAPEDLSVCGKKELRLKEIYDVTVEIDEKHSCPTHSVGPLVVTFRAGFVDYEFDRGQPDRYKFSNGVCIAGEGFTAVLVS